MTVKCQIKDERGETGCENEACYIVERNEPGFPTVFLCATHLVTFGYQELSRSRGSAERKDAAL